MKKKSFIYGAVILSFAGIIAKGMGAFYKIPLTNILGSQGIGIYYLIFPIYSILLVLCSSGISVAVSRFVAVERSRGNVEGEKRVLKIGLVYSTILSLICATLLVVLASYIAEWQGNINSRLGLVAIAPAIIFASLVAVFRGYFQGLENMIPTSASNIIEQGVKIGFGLYFANLFLYKGVSFAVLGATLSVSLCELVALFIIYINYLFDRRKSSFEPDKNVQSTYRPLVVQMGKYSFFATISCLIMPLCGLFDSFVIINILLDSGFSMADATSLYGISCGVVSTIISIPVIFTVAITTVLVPNVSGIDEDSLIATRCAFLTKISWILSLFCFIIILVLGQDIIRALFGHGLTVSNVDELEFATKLLQVSSASVIYYSFVQIFSGILQAINKPQYNSLAMGISFVVRCALIYLLVSIKEINIFGQVIGQSVFLIISCMIQLYFIKKYMMFRIEFNNFVTKPILVALIVGAAVYGLDKVLYGTNVWVSLVLCGMTAIILYTLLIWKTKVFNVVEQNYFPKISFRKKKISSSNEK